MNTPKCLQPVVPEFLKKNSPAWFSGVPKLFPLRDKTAMTLHSLSWRDRYGVFWTVPKGFITDGASVPWLLRWLWNPWDEATLRPAIIHDMRYMLHDYAKDWPTFDFQKRADLSLLDGMKIDCPQRARTYYIAVRLVGRAVYEHISYEQRMKEWLQVVCEPDKLNDWILKTIETDRQ
jgi:hypothetical protein